jgi:TRAP-type C4-dicarboxylate transport system permease small subunit
MVSQAYKRLLSVIEFMIEHVATYFFILFFIAVLLQVIFRYVLSLPLTWSEEAARYLNIWAVLLGAALAVKRREHLRVDLIDIWLKKWPLRAQITFYLTTTFLSILVVVSLIKGSYHMTIDRWSVMLTIIPLPQGVVYLALLVGSSLMLFFLINQLISHIINWVNLREGSDV